MAIDLDALDAGTLAPKTYRTVDGERATLDRLARGAGGDGTTATRQAAPDLFIVVRPKADRLVYVLLSELAKLDAEAAAAGKAWYERNRETLPVKQGSDWITKIRAKIASYEGRPVTPTPAAPASSSVWDEWHKVAGELAAMGGQHGAGFAVDTEDGATNEIAFWRIVPGRNGKFWLRQVIGGSGAVRVRMTPQAMLGVARKIVAAGPKDAMLRYGMELGECGHCYRTLTNDESRAIGIGPVCRNKKGW